MAKKVVKGKSAQPLRKAVKKAAQKKNTVQVEDKSDEQMTLLERVRRESEEVRTAKGKRREIARIAFWTWLGIPARYRGAPDQVLAKLGINDADVLELAKIGSLEEFKRLCNVSHQAVADWRREFDDSDEGKDTRKIFRGLVRELLASLYLKGLEHGDAERFKVFAAYVENWVPGAMTSDPGAGIELRPDERAHLDKLIERNSVKA